MMSYILALITGLPGLVLGINLAGSAALPAEPAFLQARCDQDFPEAMSFLQNSIRQRGYTISRVQHVDKGLKQRGYQSLKYKVVFFGKADEIDDIRLHYPQLLPYIPLSITITQQERFNIISGLRPKKLAAMFTSRLPMDFFERWEKDFNYIFARYNKCSESS